MRREYSGWVDRRNHTHLARHARTPIGFPKVLVSTVASGDTSSYVGTSDITMMYSVVDIAGINSISGRILANAAGAIAGMVAQPPLESLDSKPVVSATMFGVTTPAVDAARQRLENLGYEVLVFHATGAGGRSMEALIKAGMISGVLDLTTTELADELVGGVFSAGPDRLTAAVSAGYHWCSALGSRHGQLRTRRYCAFAIHRSDAAHP